MLEWVKSVMETPITVEAGSLWLPAAGKLFLYLQVSLTRYRTMVTRNLNKLWPRGILVGWAGSVGLTWCHQVKVIGGCDQSLPSSASWGTHLQSILANFTCQRPRSAMFLRDSQEASKPLTITLCCSSMQAPTILSREIFSVPGVTIRFQGPRWRTWKPKFYIHWTWQGKE